MNTKIKTSNFTIENLNPQIAELYLKENEEYFVLDFGKKNKGDLTTVTFIFDSEEDKNIVMTGSSCGCTNPSFSKISKNSQHVVVQYDSSKITNNVSKWVTLTLNDRSVVKINIVINKL